jgi:hypothetical protein
MLLRNYYNQLFSIISEQVIENGLKTPDGTLGASYCPSSSSNLSNSIINSIRGLNGVSTSYSHRYLVVGSGSTPASVDDYMLESMITTSVSSGGISNSIDNDGNFVIIANVKNNGSSTITINEIGIPSNCYNGSSSSVVCLIERTVLDEPITLVAGESCFISYKVRFASTVGAFPTE